jgi:exodeoxyribonuclease-3
MRLISWNVNGIRAAARKGLVEWVNAEVPDVLCIQEIKAQPEQLESELVEPVGYHTCWNPAQRKGYSGVATWARSGPLAFERGLGVPEFDSEGRVLMTEHPGFKLFNVYFPNGQRDLGRLDFKLRFYDAFLTLCDALHARGEQLVVCGDFNTAHQSIDLARPKQNQKTSGFMPEEREWIVRYLAHGFVDTFRALHPEATEQYTWWTYMRNARARNIGWRIDYFLVSESLLPAVVSATILDKVMGSDHCPIGLELDLDRLQS